LRGVIQFPFVEAVLDSLKDRLGGGDTDVGAQVETLLKIKFDTWCCVCSIKIK
jgi:hypothetical protein